MYTIGLQAQTRDFDLRTTSFNGIDVGYSAAPFFTDLDQDGLLDLVIGDQDGFLRIYEQDEVNSTSFSGHTPFFMEGDDLNDLDVGSMSSPCFVNLDNDEHLEVIIGAYHYNANLYVQAGDGYRLHHISTIVDNIDGDYVAPFVIDLDNNNKLDLLIGMRGDDILHYEQSSINSLDFTLISSSFSGLDLETPIVIDLL